MARIILVLGVMLGGCVETAGKLTEEQFNDLIGADRDVIAETGVEDIAETAVEDTVEDIDVVETIDAVDTADTVEDTADTSEVVDTAEDTADTADTNEVAETVADTIADGDGEVTPIGCDDEPSLVTPECLPAEQPLFLFEPAYEGSAQGPPLGFVRAERGNGASTWERAGEPVEIALANGSLADPALAAYVAFDDTLDAVGGDFAFDEGPPVPEVYQPSQPGLSQSLEAAPRWRGPIDPTGTGSFTLMAWVYVDAGRSPTADYDLLGCEPDAGVAELALGLTGSSWTALLQGERVAFGAIESGWSHLALVWDEAEGIAVLYLDGAVGAVAEPALNVTGTEIFIGAMFPMPPHDLGPPPRLDELVRLTRALDGSEVRAYVQMHAPFGERLVPEAQADFDDLRVVRDGAAIEPREIIGRRPHGDSGAEIDSVVGVWGFDGLSLTADYAASGFDANDTGIGLVADPGPFGDNGAIRGQSPGPAALAVGRPPWGGSGLTVELWVDVDPAEAATACATDADGATLIVAQDQIGGLAQGFVLRLCDGRLDFRTSAAAVTGTTVIADGRWHHVMASYDAAMHTVVVDGFLDGSAATVGTPADQNRALILLHRPPPETGGDPPTLTRAALDDLVVHNVARAPSYGLNRAWPVLPHVRILASTGIGPELTLPAYALRAGNPDVAAPELNACGSLVSSCTGVVAWWRIDGPYGERDLVVDAGEHGLHLTRVGDSAWVPGADGGLALAIDGGAGVWLEKNGGPELGLDHWQVEAAVRPLATTALQSVVERPGLVGAEVALNYGLRLQAGGFPQHEYRVIGAPPVEVHHTIAAGAGVWSVIGGGYDFAGKLSVSLFDDLASLLTGSAPTPDVTGGSFFVGHSAGPVGPYAGDVDALRIMSRALAGAQLQKFPPLAWRPE